MTIISTISKSVKDISSKKEFFDAADKIASKLPNSKISQKLQVVKEMSNLVKNNDIKGLANLASSKIGIDPNYVNTANNIITQVGTSFLGSGITDQSNNTGNVSTNTSTAESLISSQTSNALSNLGVPPALISEAQGLSSELFKSITNNKIGEFISAPTSETLSKGGEALMGYLGINSNALKQALSTNPEAILKSFDASNNLIKELANGNIDDDLIEVTITPLEDANDILEGMYVSKIDDDFSFLESEDYNDMGSPAAYALDMVTPDVYPKYKFLFVVQFIFNEDFIGTLGENADKMAFIIKDAQRPNVSFEYEEINLYNFRTKIPKRSTYNPIEMTFWDDNNNQATSFFKKYMELMIPNSRMDVEQSAMYEESTFNFESTVNSSSYQTLPGGSGHKSILKNINLFHIYNFGKNVTAYKFINPKITELSLSDLSMDTSDLSDVKINFSYDGLYIDTNEGGKPLKTYGKYDIKNYSGDRFAISPLEYKGNDEPEHMNEVTDLPPELYYSSYLEIQSLTDLIELYSQSKESLNNAGVL